VTAEALSQPAYRPGLRQRVALSAMPITASRTASAGSRRTYCGY